MWCILSIVIMLGGWIAGCYCLFGSSGWLDKDNNVMTEQQVRERNYTEWMDIQYH